MQEPQINLNGWMTIKALAAKRGCSTHALSMQIKRGQIPFREFPELNGLKLVLEPDKIITKPD
jgi:hypothetical protein